jgi:hypothetical protein
VRVSLVSHASVIIETSDLRIWTDPWLSGKAFNDSWSLLVPAAFDPALLDGIDYLWISHEHPDHFHIPTLRALPDSFKRRVTLLFQDDRSEKMFRAFGKLGFPNHRRLPHREWVPLSAASEVYCHQVGAMDSALAVRSEGRVVLNVNDCELDARACRLLRRDLGDPDVVLNQFSVAGYDGDPDHTRLQELAEGVLRNVADNARDLHAGATIPIASFAYFSTTENRYVNAYANTPADCLEVLEAAGERCVVLYPGDGWEVGAPHDPRPALARFDAVYASLDRLPLDEPASASLEAIADAFVAWAADLHGKYPGWLLRFLGALHVRIPDLRVTVRLDVANQRFSEAPDVQPDLAVSSQALEHTFRHPFGIQTLGVSARSVLLRNRSTWKRHRILSSAYNAELYLRPRFVFSRDTLRYARARLRGGAGQLRHKLGRMSGPGVSRAA